MTSDSPASTITMFGAEWCRDCRRTKAQLDDLGVEYTYVDLDADPAAAEVAREISGPEAVDGRANREMGSEDFSYMLEARPGAYLFLGTGPGAGLHHSAYDFNDEAAPIGASFFARLVERAQPVAG